MADRQIHIPARKKQPVTTDQVVKITAEAYNALTEIYNESSCSMKQIVSLLVLNAADLVVYDKEDGDEQ